MRCVDRHEMTKRFGIKLLAIGALGGLLFGLTYWYAWGCRKCAKDNNPIALIGFCTVVGAGMARAWGGQIVERSS
jgi:hypothetical protein